MDDKAEAAAKKKVETFYTYSDENISAGLDYYYCLKVAGKDGSFSLTPVFGPVKSMPQWFNTNRINVLVGSLTFVIIVLICIFLAKGGKEFFVRKIAGIDAVDEAIGRATEMGKPILYVTGLGSLGDIATLQIGGEMRRGVGELDGRGEAVGGVIVSRFGENAYKVIQDAKKRLFELEDGLPPGVMIIPTYDRSQLIERAVHTLRDTLIEEIVVVGLVCILFLLHARSELVAVFVVPSSVVVSLLVMNLLGMNANIMSLGGIAISIGVVVDSANTGGNDASMRPPPSTRSPA